MYVNSILVSVEFQNLLFRQFQHIWILGLVDFCILSGLKLAKYQIVKIAVIKSLILPKSISRKIWMAEISTLWYSDSTLKIRKAL